MNILKALTIYFITAIIPVLALTLLTDGSLRIALISVYFICWFTVFLYSDKFILQAIGAREIIDADNQELFQAIKGKTYRHHEKVPRVYLYTGHRNKIFVLDKPGDWVILLDRSLIKGLNKEQVEALVSFCIDYKKKGHGRIQTIGMGVLSVMLKSILWFWDQFKFGKTKRIYSVGVFVTLIMIKPLFEVVLKLSKVHKNIECPFALKSVYYQVDNDVINRSFTEYMTYHLNENSSVTDLIVEFLEEYPMLENCYFKEA